MIRIAFICVLSLSSSCVVKQTQVLQEGLKSNPRAIIRLVCDESCTDAEAERLPALEAKLNATLGSECFRDFILTPNRPWTHLEDRTPQDVLELMLKPKVILVRYFTNLAYNIQGYEVAEQAVININRLSVTIRRMNLCREAAVMAHEIAHANGLHHKGNEPDEYNQLSPPYQINHAFEPRAEDYLNGGCCL